jgi:hypothetical protein
MLMEASNQSTELQTRLYRRELPGAGYVAIDLTSVADDAETASDDRPRIRVYVERRASEDRRAGHVPPVVAEFAGDQGAPEVGELYRLASDNAALARALIEWQGRRDRGPRDD